MAENEKDLDDYENPVFIKEIQIILKLIYI